jgi:hypothetical protein
MTGKYGVFAVRQPNPRAGQCPEAGGVGAGLSESGSQGRFAFVMASIWGMSDNVDQNEHGLSWRSLFLQ